MLNNVKYIIMNNFVYNNNNSWFTNITVKNKTAVSRVINQGGFGCIFYPRLPCKKLILFVFVAYSVAIVAYSVAIVAYSVAIVA